MYLLSLFALIAVLAAGAVTVLSVMSGVGVFVFFCIAAILCVVAGVGLLLKLLSKGIFSLFKCVVFLGLMLVPIVNIIALCVISVTAYKALSDSPFSANH